MRKWPMRATGLSIAIVVVFLLSSVFAQQPQRTPPPSTLRAPTRAEILRGEYGRYRANNDLLYYDLDVRVDPEKKWISGKNTIRFKMLKDDTRIQLELFCELHHRSIVHGHADAEVHARSQHGLHRFPGDAAQRAAPTRSSFTTPASRAKIGRFDALAFKKDPAGEHWINTANEGVGSACGGRARISGATNPKAWTSAWRSRTASSTCRTGDSSSKTDLGDGYTKWHYRVHYPINSYNVSLNIADYVHFGETMGDLTIDYYVLPGQPREGEAAVRAGEADDRGVREVLRRVSVQEGRLQADRSAVLGHGAPERRHLRQSLRERLPRARLDRRRRQPQVRLHHHPRERARVVRQRRVGRRRSPTCGSRKAGRRISSASTSSTCSATTTR